MVTGFDLIHHNKPLQKHWVKRVIAYLADFFISSILIYIPLYLLGIAHMPRIFIYFPAIAGAFQVFYSAVLEFNNRQTLGKILLNLEVEGLRGGVALHEAIARNLSKIHGLIVLVDAVLGLATEGDPRQRYLDRMVDTTVTGTAEPHHFQDYIKRHREEEPEEEPQPHFMERGIEDIRKCRECGGRLEEIGFGESRCVNCGRIQ